MANIPGISGYSQPNVFSRVRTIRRSVSIPGGLRVLAVVGLGESDETIVLNAKGSGADGVNADYSGSSNPDGRHFVLSKTNLVPKRTSFFIDGVPLTVLEQTIDSDPFDSRYDCRFEPSTGRLELQRAFLVDQGGMYAPGASNNVGNGTVSLVELKDANAPAETWTIKATSVIRDAYGDPITGLTTFAVIGSVSGQLTDSNGVPYVIVSNGTAVNNGVLNISITEGSVPFERGDRFTVKVDSKVLKKGQTLEAKYIAEENLYDPEFFTDANALYAKHGIASATNTLSLGASLAFENGAFGVYAIQAKPTLPRKTSEVVLERDDPLSVTTEGFPSIAVPVTSESEFAFSYTINGIPDPDTNVNIFVIDRSSGKETQIFPTKVAFYNSTIESDPFNEFIKNVDYTYSYTVIMADQVEDEGDDGVVVSGESIFTASSAVFSGHNLDLGEVDTSKKIKILSKDKYGNDVSSVAGTYDILSVGDGYGNDNVVTLSTTFATSVSNLRWELVDSADQSAKVLLTSDLYSGGTIKARDGLRVSYIDSDDADFYDANWAQAFESLETIECQMVVPLPDACFSAVQQAAIAHCELMSNTANQKERVALIGAQIGVTSAALIGQELVAVEDIGILEGIQGDDPEEVLQDNIEDLQNFDVRTNFGTSFRSIYFWPDEIIRVINGTNTAIHGFYIAAAAGGWFAANANLAMPLTNKVLVGFTIPRSKISRPIILNALGDRGVSVLQPVVGGGRLLHCKTTIFGGDATEEEPSVIFIRDRTAQVLRDVLKGFIGKPQDSTFGADITSNVVKALSGLVSQGLLSTSRNVSVSRDQVDPRQWNVSVEVYPVIPCNWIFIDISVSI